MGPLIRYTVARLALFAVPFVGLLYLLGTRLWLLAAGISVLVSGMLSLIVLSRQRDDFSTVLSERLHGLGRGIRAASRRIDNGAAAEDAADEQRRASSSGDGN